MDWTPQHQAPTIFPGSRDPHGCTSALLPAQGGANAHPWKEASLSHLNPITASSLGQSPLPLPRPQDCQDSRANAEGTAPVLSFKTGKLRLGSRRDLSQAPMFTAEPQPEPVLGWVCVPGPNLPCLAPGSHLSPCLGPYPFLPVHIHSGAQLKGRPYQSCQETQNVGVLALTSSLWPVPPPAAWGSVPASACPGPASFSTMWSQGALGSWSPIDWVSPPSEPCRFPAALTPPATLACFPLRGSTCCHL